ncbi:MAG: DUF2339 domain-containing protein [Chthoniobacterales bacterium]
MEAIGCYVALALLLLAAPFVIALVALMRVSKLQRELRALKERLDGAPASASSAVPPAPVAASVPIPSPVVSPPVAPAPPRAPTTTPPPPTAPPSKVNLESILGVKLFAWIGGFAFFLGTVFFVKYAFDNNLITPVMRVVIGAIVGLLLVAGGGFASTRRYRVPAQSLCATGILVLYADIYAAHAFYSLIPLGVASVAMCVVTAGALWLAMRLAAQSVVWLAALGGFLTPTLLWTNHTGPVVLFGYVALLNFGLTAVASIKRWNYFVLLAAIGTIATEIGWSSDFLGPAYAELTRRTLLLFAAQFLAIAALRPQDNWRALATALTAFAPLFFCIVAADDELSYPADFAFPILFFGCAILLGLAAARRAVVKPDALVAVFVAVALGLTWIAEWGWRSAAFDRAAPFAALVWFVAILLLFAAAPHFAGINRLWPWSVAAAVGPLQFWFVYQLATAHLSPRWMFIVPAAFALPPALNAAYLIGRERVTLASGDNRLATQVIAVLFFVSAIIPVQFEREWITLGWAIEGVALLLVYRRIPNAQLRVIALVVLGAAFCRLTLNPAVFEYHKRAPIRIWNWYLYAYGIAAVCMFVSARLFSLPLNHWYERLARPLLGALGTVVLFLLLNIEIADYFSVGPTLTFSFSGDFARDMTYTIAWALFALVLLLIGVFRKVRGLRFAAIGLLCLALGKLFLHDLDQLSQLYRIVAFLSVAVVAIAASFIYQRFLAPTVRQPPPSA